MLSWDEFDEEEIAAGVNTQAPAQETPIRDHGGHSA